MTGAPACLPGWTTASNCTVAETSADFCPTSVPYQPPFTGEEFLRIIGSDVEFCWTQTQNEPTKIRRVDAAGMRCKQTDLHEVSVTSA